MRGKASNSLSGSYVLGITPAYAGKSKLFRFFYLCLGDHPRLCGEKNTSTQKNFLSRGSPPPMRGKVCSTAT